MSLINGSDSGTNDCVTVAEWVANAIADTGARVVYGGHGGAIVPMVNAICDHPLLEWVVTRNEHDAAEMAAAHAKLTGGLGVVIATSGPGATNLTTGLLEAVYDRVPLLAITAMKPTAQIGYAEFQDCNQSRLFAGAGVEWSKDAASPEAVIPLLRDAVATAVTHRTCAALAIPVDIQAAKSPLPLKHFCASKALERVQPVRDDKQLIEEAAKDLVGTIEKIPRNVIAVGLRACYSKEKEGNGPAILELAEALNAPVLTRLDAKGVVDEKHPLSFGVVGVHGKPGMESAAAIISGSDRVICIGVDDETLLICNVAGLQIRKVIEIEPDSYGLSTRYEAEHTLVGPISQICRDLALSIETRTIIRNRKERVDAIMKSMSKDYESEEEELEELDKFGYMAHLNPNAIASSSDPSDPPLFRRFSSIPNVKSFTKESCRLWQMLHSGDWTKLAKVHVKTKYSTDLTVSRPGYCHPAAVMEAISRARRSNATDMVARNATICVDVGDVTLWSSLSLTLQGGSRILYSERLGTMGYGLCAGVAAIKASPSPSGAIVLAGDGGFQMSLQELATFQQTKKPGDKLICFVFDNQVLGRVAFGFDNAAGCEFLGPDYVQLAKAYGGDAVRLDDTSKAGEVVAKAMAAEGLFIVHVWLDPLVKGDMASFKDNSIQVMNSG